MPAPTPRPAWPAALLRALLLQAQQHAATAAAARVARPLLTAVSSSLDAPLPEHGALLAGASAQRPSPADTTAEWQQQEPCASPMLVASTASCSCSGPCSCAGPLRPTCLTAHRSCHGPSTSTFAEPAPVQSTPTGSRGLLSVQNSFTHAQSRAGGPLSMRSYLHQGLGTAIWQAQRARCLSAEAAEKIAQDHACGQNCSHHGHQPPHSPHDATSNTHSHTSTPSTISSPSSPSSSTQPPSQAAVGVSTLQSGAGFKKTFYKRHLPSPPAIAFASPEGKQLFAEALADGTMAGFFKLVEQFSTQDEPAFCGLTSLSMVLNALSIDPRRTWKGAWRWFHEGMLDCCRPLDTVRRDGITLIQAAVLARCNGARVDMRRSGSFTEEEFRQQVEQVCTSGEEHLVLSYSRRAFSQTGDGHFSPVGGYHRGRDLVLILDVARFKYPPHWVSLKMLYEAMSRLDPVTGLPRGYLLMSAHHLLDSAMFTLDVRQEGWQQARAYAAAMPALLKQQLATAATGGATGAEGRQAGISTSMGVGVPSHAGPATSASQQQQSRPSPGAATPASATPATLSTTTPATPATPLPPPPPAVTAALRQLLQKLPLDSAMLFVVVREQAVGPADRCVPHGARDALLAELRGLPLYQVVAEVLRDKHAATSHAARPSAAFNTIATTAAATTQAVPSIDTASNTGTTTGSLASGSMAASPSSFAPAIPQSTSTTAAWQPAPSQCGGSESFLAERVTLLLLLQPASEWPDASGWGSAELAAHWHALMDLTGYSIVAAEVAYLQQQFVNVEQVLHSGSVEATCGVPACSNKLDCAAHGHA